MANKILKLNASVPDETNKSRKVIPETYRDISMIAKQHHSDDVVTKIDEFGEIISQHIISNTKYTIEKHVDIDAVKNSIRNIFTWIKGERVLDPEFGTNIRAYLYNPIDSYNTEQVIAEIQNAMKKYEPRAEIDKITNISTVDDTENNTIELEVVWHVVGLPDDKYTDSILI